jgi:hypothetical protein
MMRLDSISILFFYSSNDSIYIHIALRLVLIPIPRHFFLIQHNTISSVERISRSKPPHNTQDESKRQDKNKRRSINRPNNLKSNYPGRTRDIYPSRHYLRFPHLPDVIRPRQHISAPRAPVQKVRNTRVPVASKLYPTVALLRMTSTAISEAADWLRGALSGVCQGV